MHPTVRVYGKSPFKIAAIHGGPGAPGYMAPVARELAKSFGVLEPLQTATSLEGQIFELKAQLLSFGEGPYILIGSSWGAVLSLFLSARFPDLVKKQILIGSAVFDAHNSQRVKDIRQSRKSEELKHDINKLNLEFESSGPERKKEVFSKILDLEFDQDVYSPLTREVEYLSFDSNQNYSVWGDFKKLRDSKGTLQREFQNVRCDTLVIHGDHDPHLIDGILPFLETCIPKIRLEWLEKCGHYPWLERFAKDRFFQILQNECAEILSSPK
jgi:pimeloyl-ACP methyl ester carboxylesterase